MSEESKIQWTNFTGWIWLVCTEVSPGCAHCYARELMMRWVQSIVRKAYKAAGFADWETRPVWGDKAPRVKTRDFEKKMLALNRKAERDGARYKVFPSMIDWLDGCPAGMIDQDGNWVEPVAALAEALDVIRRCPNLDFLLLTKRTENWAGRLLNVQASIAMEMIKGNMARTDLANWIKDWLQKTAAPANVWIGTTCENQEWADKRLPELLKIPAVCRFVSYEPALGPVDFELCYRLGPGLTEYNNTLDGNSWQLSDIYGGAPDDEALPKEPRIHWVIVGGESGSGARPFNLEWARRTIAQCQDAGVACFVKQLGAFPICDNANMWDWPDDAVLVENGACVASCLARLKDKKGGDMAEWPDELRVREFPTVRSNG